MTLVVALIGAALAWFAFGRPAYLTTPQHTGNRPNNGNGRRSVADVSIIIPARDEERTLPTLLASIKNSTIAPAEIIVVDDNSTDTTADVARELGADVITAPPPDGWLGKPWACHLGAQRAQSARLLFLDADVHLSPAALDALLAHKADQGSGLLSVQPQHRPVRTYEQLSVMFNVVGPMGCGAFGLRRVQPLRAAFGPCLMTDAADYTTIGGYESVRGEVIEDLALAARFADAGRNVRVLLGDGLISYRMYPDGFRTLIDGWTKNIAAGASRTNRFASLVAVLWVTAMCSTALSVMLGLVASAQGDGNAWLPLAAWGLAAAQIFVLMRRVGRFHPLVAVIFPLPLFVFVAVFARSALLLLLNRPVRWRGRDVPSRPTHSDRA